MIVGGYATIFHGYARTTMDLDVWVERTWTNYSQLVKALSMFGMPVFDMSEAAFLSDDSLDVFTFGRPPVCIDIMNRVKGLKFEASYGNSEKTKIQGVTVRFLSRDDLIKAKRASGRHRDLDDLENL